MNKLGLPKFGWIHNPTELTHVDVEENAESNTLFHNSKQGSLKKTIQNRTTIQNKNLRSCPCMVNCSFNRIVS